MITDFQYRSRQIMALVCTSEMWMRETNVELFGVACLDRPDWMPTGSCYRATGGTPIASVTLTGDA